MHKTRPRLRTALAAFAGALLLGSGLAPGLTAAGAAHEPPAARDDGPVAPDLQQVTLAKGVDQVGEPMALAVLPDGAVLHTSRDGTLWHTGAAGGTRVAARLPVYPHDEDGLQGVGVDPDFEDNRAVYLYYAPVMDTPHGIAPSDGQPADFEAYEGVNRLSRFTLNEDGTLDLGSEKTVLEVGTDRGRCCHNGGDIAFDSAGNLLLSTGDDTDPFASDGYTPIDERETRNPSFDGQRSAGNTNDLRGKILRIKVDPADGSYTVPDGNLFAPGTEKTRPEIYAMGFRNPFRMSVDQATGTVYVGDYGPDSGAADPARGPGGQVEFNRITEAGNFGWPYCHGENDAYIDYDFATGTSGAAFDCAAPRNESPRNTGLTELPPAQPAWIAYDGDSLPEFGSGSESPMAGPVFRHNPDLDSRLQLPERYDELFFAGEHGREWIKTVAVGEDGGVAGIEDFSSGSKIMDMEFGPDGALYFLDYGTGFFNGDANSALYRIQNAAQGFAPEPAASSDATSGHAPLKVAFSSAGTADRDSEYLTYRWDFGDGRTSGKPNPKHTYSKDGEYSAVLTVTDPDGNTGTSAVRVVVGNTPPEVELKLPEDGTVFEYGDAIPFEVSATDAEDGEADCSRVRVDYALGHDTHGHPMTFEKGCTGTIEIFAEDRHDDHANLFGLIRATYTDGGGATAGVPALNTSAEHKLQPAHRQAEHFDTAEGAAAADADGAEGGRAVTGGGGEWIAFEPYVLSGIAHLSARVDAAGGAGGALELRAGAPDGPVLATAPVGGAAGWSEVSAEVTDAPAGTTSLYLVLTGGEFALDSFHLGRG
ncbi:PQQ-dependent sugar dehydrogenase [Streptomyces sp. MAR4 CNX-425]|uniref:PQQ-dependent sugar dehydrogenase n=1 Tax=Streptomyces sp. MAR4 CNX-425 TaxID=3406343 RepID=UPI003B503233